MVDADDFDVEGLRALLRGEAQPQQKPAATAPKTAAPKKAAARAKAKAAKPTARTKKSGKR